MGTRTLGRWMGLAAGLLGFGGWVLALGVASAMSSFSARTVFFFIVMLLAIGGVGIGAYQYNDSGRTIWRSLLVSATLLLVMGTVLSGFTVGILFVPAAMLALAATIFSFLDQTARTA
jgi:hypothetical protein